MRDYFKGDFIELQLSEVYQKLNSFRELNEKRNKEGRGREAERGGGTESTFLHIVNLSETF